MSALYLVKQLRFLEIYKGVIMKNVLLFVLIILTFAPLWAQVNVKKYNESQLVVAQNKWDSLIVKDITLYTSYGSTRKIDGNVMLKKKDWDIDVGSFQVEFVKADVKYIDPVSSEEKIQTLKLKMKSKWVNPFGERIRCQAITKKGTQCSRYTTSRNGKCWQHGGD